MFIPVKRVTVAAVALIASILPVAEIGLFGYETFLVEEEKDDRRDQSFQDLMAMEAQISLHAAKAALLPEGPERADRYHRMDDAIRLWEDVFQKWREGDYENMWFTNQQARRALEGQGSDPGPDGEPLAEWLEGDVSEPAFPWLLVIIPAAVAVVAWAVVLGVKVRRRGSEQA